MNKEYYDFIWSENEIKKMFDILKPLEDDDVYFMSLSARKKYLTKEEEENIQLTKTIMFQRKLVKKHKFSHFLKTVKEYEMRIGSILSKGNDSIVPQKCMLIYLTINPCSSTRALKRFYSKSQELLFNSYSDKSLIKNFRRVSSMLNTCFQQSMNKSKLIDIDMDIGHNNTNFLHRLLKEFDEKEVKYHVIQTRGGYHVLIEKNTINYNYTKRIHSLNKEAKKINEKYEIIINKNGMIPLPGTIQAGFKVKFIPRDLL